MAGHRHRAGAGPARDAGAGGRAAWRVRTGIACHPRGGGAGAARRDRHCGAGRPAGGAPLQRQPGAAGRRKPAHRPHGARRAGARQCPGARIRAAHRCPGAHARDAAVGHARPGAQGGRAHARDRGAGAGAAIAARGQPGGGLHRRHEQHHHVHQSTLSCAVRLRAGAGGKHLDLVALQGADRSRAVAGRAARGQGGRRPGAVHEEPCRTRAVGADLRPAAGSRRQPALLRLGVRHLGALRRPGAAAPRQGDRRGSHAHEDGFPGQHEPRDPHADERDHRHGASRAQGRSHAAPARLPGQDPVLEPAPAGHHQRHPRPLQGGGGQAAHGAGGLLAREGAGHRVRLHRRQGRVEGAAAFLRRGARRARSNCSATPCASGRCCSTTPATRSSSPSRARST